VAEAPSEQGCQMVYFQTKNPNLGKFWRALNWTMVIYFMAIWNGIFFYHLVHFVFIWYILGSFVFIWYHFPVLVSCTKKNLATLLLRHVPSAQKFSIRILEISLTVSCLRCSRVQEHFTFYRGTPGECVDDHRL
jgi:hypothetical protein